MKVVKIKKDLINILKKDPELMVKEDRPCVLVVRLCYKEKNRDFAVPLRSNIPPATPKEEYFNLPPRSSTKEKHHHRIHYSKIFPVSKEYYDRYRTEGDPASTLICAIIDKHEKEIVEACQAYLNRYEDHNRPQYATDLDLLISLLPQKEKSDGRNRSADAKGPDVPSNEGAA